MSVRWKFKVPRLVSLINCFAFRLLLKLHHTTKAESGEERRIRFIRVDITKSNDTFAAVDEEWVIILIKTACLPAFVLCSDNIFIFHLTEKCFWQLPEVKVHKCSAMRFRPHQSNNLLIGNESGFIYELEISEYDSREFILRDGHEFLLFSPWKFIGNRVWRTHFLW